MSMLDHPPSSGSSDESTRASRKHTSTAEMIARAHEPADRATMAAVGVALHHLTEPLNAPLGIELHRATTVLTKQARPLIDRPEGLEEILALVTDPDRAAMPDGRTASELCGRWWPDIAATASKRAASACEGAEAFGRDAVLNLAVIRGVNARRPWWGTTAWAWRVEEWFADYQMSARLHKSLLTAPEGVADDVLWDVLSR